MNKIHNKEDLFLKVKDAFGTEHKKLENLKESKKLFSSYKKLNDACRDIPFDWQFNAIHWVFGIRKICDEIAFSLSWMKAYAEVYKAIHPPESALSHTNFQISYFADNCITRIDSCKDKIALMIWSYYCPFDPRENVLIYEHIRERIAFPLKFGLNIKGVKKLLNYLDLLNNDAFDQISRYRHMKIHRREPRIEIYGPKTHHDWPYMVPLYKTKEKEKWHKKVDEKYPDMEKWDRESIKKSCYIKGILFDQEVLKERLWAYNDIENLIYECFLAVLKSASGCFHVLSLKKPFKKNRPM
ncbi:MAG: Cthe_2314 family HEPN domain-containing protein [Candidatus Omnitrophica bacterium]|jgi:hypothetical protein|nr:Cthe_2314 family HEPN domain-containing protein [Candidatus Omnitrophota bacterium]